VQVQAKAEDPDGIATAELRVNDKPVANQLTSGGSTADLQFTWTPQDPGDYTLRVRARDNEGKWGEAVITVSAGTGLPPLPPPPTTLPRTTLDPGTSTTPSFLGPAASSTPTTGPSSVAATTTRPAPAPPPTVAPTAPTTPTTDSTIPTTDTTIPTTDTTIPTTDTTIPTTDTTTTATPVTQVTQAPCRLESAVLLLPVSRSSLVLLQPTFVWTYAGACPPTSQVLVLSMPGGHQAVALSGAARSYVPAAPLPACTRVRWSVTAVDAYGRARGTRAEDFTTAC
jgi:hypothetical protein